MTTVSKPKLQARLEQALRLCHNGAFREAEQLCRSIVAVDDGHADAWNTLAAVLLQLGLLKDAIAAAERATSLRPDIAPYWLTRGNVTLSLAQVGLAGYDEAERSLANAVRLAPGLAEAQFRLGLCRTAVGRIAESVDAFRAAARLAPEVAEIHFRLAESLMHECQWDAAMQSFQTAFVNDPDRRLDRYSSMQCMGHLQILSLPDFWHAELMHYFGRSDINKARHASLGVRALKAKPLIREAINCVQSGRDVRALAAPALRTLTEDALLQLMLREVVITDAGMEHLLSSIRTALLLDCGFREQTPVAFACALAQQCFNNEFVYAASAAETAAIHLIERDVSALLDSGSVQPEARLIATLASYRPLHDFPGMAAYTAGTPPAALAALLERSVTNVLTERAECALIGTAGPIVDETSRAVSQMYEENPYPRWFSLDRFAPVSLDQWLLASSPAVPAPSPAGASVRILVAGCGTGKEACELAVNIAGAQVLAVDLSRSSLAYAQRMAKALGIHNIVFRQADLLNLEATESGFDLVSSSGVLHHMRDPAAGLLALTQQLRGGGVLRVALYSERARSVINLARAEIERREIRPNIDAIRQFRQFVQGLPEDAPLKALSRLNDFYSLSTCRDLVFHVMEHQFRLPQIETLLHHAGLIPVDLVEGLGTDVTAEYLRRFPDDPAMLDFRNWDLFEAAFPNTFAHMFSIRCRKRVDAAVQTPTSIPS